MSAANQPEYLTLLRKILDERFNEDELQTLCFDLGVDYESLGGDTKAGKARELVSYCDRHACIPKLLDLGKLLRPDILWDQVRVADGSEPAASSTPPDELVVSSSKFPDNEPYYPVPEREQEIKGIVDALCHPQGRPVVMVNGLGGIGKTALAVEVARRFKRTPGDPFQAIAWESAKQKTWLEGKIVKLRDAQIDLPELLDSLGQQLRGPDFARLAESQRKPALKEALCDRRCLVVLDNLETTTNADEIMFSLQDLLGPSRVLGTSRTRISIDSFQMLLKGLAESSSVTFLKKEGEERGFHEIEYADPKTLAAIHRATEGMPLAMKWVVGQIQVRGLTRTLEDLKHGHADIYTFLFHGAWGTLSDQAKRLIKYIGSRSSAVSREELDRAFQLPDDHLDQAIEELIRLSLLDARPLRGLAQRGYSIHQLTRYFVLNDLAGS